MFDWRALQKHKIISICYFSAIAIAFVLSLSHNNNVEASTDAKDYLSPLIDIAEPVPSSLTTDFETQEAPDNIKAMFELMDNMINYQSARKEITIQRGDTLISSLTRLGIAKDEANQIYHSVKSDFSPSSLKAGQKIELFVSVDTQKNNQIIGVNLLTIKLDASRRVRVVRRDGEFETFTEEDELIEVDNAISGTFNGAVSVSMRNAGVSQAAVVGFTNLFNDPINFSRDIHKGDKFTIVYKSLVNKNHELVKTGKIIYAELKLRNQTISLYRFEDGKSGAEYYQPNGQALKRALDRKPLAFKAARISSPFGRRLHPILKKHIIHWGVDYAAPKGTQIYAGGDGVVQVAKYNGGYGNYIKIRHNAEYSTAYGHMSGFAKGIRAGVRVTQGQLIGYVGSTGRSTGPHLHYEVIQNGKRVNPLTIKASAGENLSGAALARFKQNVASIDKQYADVITKQPAKTKLARK
ncbi:MAG: peptidoglycan DD-metalloendopeptidase family protein [Alphaproteobacteria bacterium]|nr:peptidoglycan DD-metalloendopeptidase family protein [Alphaproteobacteria bacterium]